VIWPTQSIETYWCAHSAGVDDWKPPFFDNSSGVLKTNCLTNDHPTVVGIKVLLERVLATGPLALPAGLVTTEKRTQWAALQKIWPSVPLIVENGIESVSPYSSYPANNALHNGETPELYSTHPYRYFTIGRQLLGAKRSLVPALNCLKLGSKVRKTCGNGNGNGGWNQGIMNAALLGDATIATKQTVNRAKTPPAKGYRFMGFAPHEQDFEPSADQFANMNSALNWMLVQPADDELGSAIVMAAWPCAWDVDFKLAAPMATTIEGSLKGGKLVSLVVTPAARKQFVHVMPCEEVPAAVFK